MAGDARPAAESGCPSAAGSEGRPGRSWTAGEESEDDESLAWGDSGAGGPTQEVVSAAAPEDEVSAEILELQAELVQVMVANRARLAEALHGALRDVGRQAEGAHHARHDAAVLRHFAAVMRDIKRAQKREKREKAQRQAQVAAKVAAQASQRRGARGADGVRLGPELWREQFKVGDHFVDMLAKRMSEVSERRACPRRSITAYRHPCHYRHLLRHPCRRLQPCCALQPAVCVHAALHCAI